MPSAFSHSFFAFTLGRVGFSKTTTIKTLLIGMFMAAMPDLDVISFNFGIPYASQWGHRGFTHSFVFAAFAAFLVLIAFFRVREIERRRAILLFVFFFLCTASHGLMDAFCAPAKGVAFFWPFTVERFDFDWQPVRSAPLSAARFFTERGWMVFKSEFTYFWIPCLILLFLDSVLTLFRNK